MFHTFILRLFPFLIGKVLTENIARSLVVVALILFPFLIGKVLTPEET